jgi:hypothetical protein
MAEEKIKCAHEPCVCDVDPGQAYCSQFCERAATRQTPGDDDGTCRCGHAHCSS